MDLRDELDLAAVLAAVAPVVGRLLRPGELDSIALGWRTVRDVDFSGVEPVYSEQRSSAYRSELRIVPKGQERWVEHVELLLDLVVCGEEMPLWIAGVDDDDLDLDATAERLYDQLQDFIAESAFGWGELRE